MAFVTDTPANVEAVQLELVRKASPARRFALMSSFSATLRKASLKTLEQRFSQPQQAKLEWIRLHYGKTLTEGLQGKLSDSRSTVNETKEALQPFITTLKQLAIPYRIVGSVASSTQGMMRATLDVDIVASLTLKHIPQLSSQLKSQYYIDEELAREAVKRGSSFNLIHLETMIKVDIFMLGNRPYDYASFTRERLETIDDLTLSFKTPEDVMLGKLEWFVQSDKTSERQWQDVLGLLKVQGSSLDFEYLRHWANELGVEALLEQALQETNQHF
jgi:hypothetical protein